MKKALIGYLAFSAMGSEMMGEEFNPKEYKQEPLNPDRLKQKQGLTEYFYTEGSLWALNDKVADKKALKRGWTNLKEKY